MRPPSGRASAPAAARPALEASLASHADWHESPITRAEYIRLHQREFWAPQDLFPAEDVTFDWWLYVNEHPEHTAALPPNNSDFPAAMRQAGARPSGNWLVALYDADTGLFIYYQYDS